MNDIITREEKLFRNVIRNPDFWKNEEGRPSSALFKDSKGVSVDRDGGREKETIISSFKERFGDNIKAIVFVDASYCYDIDCHLVYNPLDDNIYHGEIHDSPQKITLSSSKARKLSKNCTIVYVNS